MERISIVEERTKWKNRIRAELAIPGIGAYAATYAGLVPST
ncbi:MAG: hypothetical protein QXW78_01485 [Candidatus Thermoplasmatota archaeon]